mmetsp:Transcript_18796/g.45264  ORF Transcript_18796/g.45264 Transcript_18796/m.45264 type:complete len:325 (-) Transcript_18796:29-1003(-)
MNEPVRNRNDSVLDPRDGVLRDVAFEPLVVVVVHVLEEPQLAVLGVLAAHDLRENLLLLELRARLIDVGEVEFGDVFVAFVENVVEHFVEEEAHRGRRRDVHLLIREGRAALVLGVEIVPKTQNREADHLADLVNDERLPLHQQFDVLDALAHPHRPRLERDDVAPHVAIRRLLPRPEVVELVRALVLEEELVEAGLELFFVAAVRLRSLHFLRRRPPLMFEVLLPIAPRRAPRPPFLRSGILGNRRGTEGERRDEVQVHPPVGKLLGVEGLGDPLDVEARDVLGELFVDRRDHVHVRRDEHFEGDAVPEGVHPFVRPRRARPV